MFHQMKILGVAIDPNTKAPVILLTDGMNNVPTLEPETAAELAHTLGVRVYTVAIGRDGVAPFPVDTPLGRRVQQIEKRREQPGGERVTGADRVGDHDISSRDDDVRLPGTHGPGSLRAGSQHHERRPQGEPGTGRLDRRLARVQAGDILVADTSCQPRDEIDFHVVEKHESPSQEEQESHGRRKVQEVVHDKGRRHGAADSKGDGERSVREKQFANLAPQGAKGSQGAGGYGHVSSH